MTRKQAKDWAQRYWLTHVKPSVECYVYGMFLGFSIGACVTAVFMSKIGLACTCADILNACK